nr:MAG TPA: ASCH domain protein [Caudoviricetes sp.]
MTKKIMFSDKYRLTQAVLAGAKTMTRRSFARFKPDARMFDEICNIEGGFDDKGRWIFTLYNKDGDIIGDMIPHYNIGEVVAIAQSYNSIGKTQYDKFGNGVPGNSNKMFTRAELMPHHIRITDIKVERLQSISDEDILKEGVWQYPKLRAYHVSKATGFAPDVAFLTAREAFAYLIDRISGRGTWGSNPWVVAYEFKLID